MNQDRERVVLASKVIDLSETKTYIDLVDRVCFYDAPNLNGVLLPSDGALEKAQTLVNMPVVAKYRQDSAGNPDLGGHEMYIDQATGEVKFGTESVGTHMSVEIKDDVVDIGGVKKTLPCLFATYRIWNRNKNVVSAVKRLFSEGKLGNSWEILSTAFTFADGVKTLTDYVFDGRALLGSGVTPAYGSNACSLSMASTNECESIIAEALAKDLNISKEDPMDNNKTNPDVAEQAIINTDPDSDQGVTATTASQDNATICDGVAEPETSSEGQEAASQINQAEQGEPDQPAEPEIAMLTVRDLRIKLTEAYRAKYPRTWGYIAYLFPTEQIAWFEDEDRESELDYVMVSYTVDNDVVSIGESTPVKLTVSIPQVNQALAERDSALASANDTINSLKDQIAELAPYKEAADVAERERVEAEEKIKREEFKARMLDTKLFSEGEIASSEHLQNMINNLDEQAMKMEIAERFMKNLSGITTVQTNVAEHVDTKRVSVADGESEKIDNSAFMRTLLGN